MHVPSSKLLLHACWGPKLLSLCLCDKYFIYKAISLASRVLYLLFWKGRKDRILICLPGWAGNNGNPPARAPQNPGIIGLHHYAQLKVLLLLSLLIFDMYICVFVYLCIPVWEHICVHAEAEVSIRCPPRLLSTSFVEVFCLNSEHPYVASLIAALL